MSKTSSGPRHFKISLVTGPVPGPTSKIRFGEVDSMAAAANDRANMGELGQIVPTVFMLRKAMERN
jgi:hypothetical protein